MTPIPWYDWVIAVVIILYVLCCMSGYLFGTGQNKDKRK